MKRINLTRDMPISQRLEIIASRIEKATLDVANDEIKSTISVLKMAGITARIEQVNKRFNLRR